MTLGRRIKKMNLGERIRKTREEKSIKQKELADKIGISYVMLSQYERGVRTPKYEMVDKIADALDIDPFYLMYGNNNPMKGFEKQLNIDRTKAEGNIDKYMLLAEVICKYCTEKQLTQKDVMLAVSIVLDKYYNDAVI